MAKPAKVIVLGDTKDAERAFGRLSKAAGRVEGNLSKISRKMGAVAKVAAKSMAAVSVAIAGVAVKGVLQFADFEKQMNEVFTLLPGISEDAMGELTDQVKDFSKEFGTLPSEVIPSLYQAISAGVPKDNVFDFLETAQKAAIGGVTDLETAVDGISSVVNAYGGDVIDAAEASDLMFTAVRLGKTNFEELSASLFNVLPTAADLGVGFEEITASIAAMTAMGTPTSVATTQMRQLLVELAKDGSKASDAFKEVAGVGFREFIAGGGDIAGAMEVIGQAAEDNDVALSDMFGSVEAGAAAMQLGGDNADKFAGILGEMGDSAGATDGAFATMDKGLSRSWDKIKATFTVALVNIGEKLAPFIESFAVAFQDKLPGMIAAAETALGNIGDFIQTTVVPAFAKLRAWWDDNGPQIIAIVQGIRDSIVAAFEFIVDKIKWVIDNWEELETPMKVIAAFIAAVMIPHWVALGVAATVSAGKQVAAWVAAKVAALQSIAAASVAIVKFIAKWVLLGLQSLLAGAKVAAAWLLALGPVGLIVAAVIAAVALIIANWDKIKVAARKVKDWLIDKFLAAVNFIKELFFNFTPLGLLIKHFDTMKRAVTGVKNWFVDKFDAVIDFLAGIPDRIGRVTSGMWDGIKDAFKSALNWIIDRWNGLEFSVPSIKAFGVTLGGFTLGTPDIPRFHSGGMFRAPTPGGEGLAILRDRETVLQPGERQGPLIGVLNLVSVADPDDIARAISWRLRTVGI